MPRARASKRRTARARRLWRTPLCKVALLRTHATPALQARRSSGRWPAAGHTQMLQLLLDNAAALQCGKTTGTVRPLFQYPISLSLLRRGTRDCSPCASPTLPPTPTRSAPRTFCWRRRSLSSATSPCSRRRRLTPPPLVAERCVLTTLPCVAWWWLTCCRSPGLRELAIPRFPLRAQARWQGRLSVLVRGSTGRVLQHAGGSPD